MENRQDYNDSALYETFLNRAFKFDSRRLGDPHNREYLNLIDAENGVKHYGQATRDKQLETMKRRVTRAVDVLLRQDLDERSKNNLHPLLAQIAAATTAHEMFAIVKIGIENSQDLIERVPRF